MNVAVVYVFPAVQPRIYGPLAQRFVKSYMKNPPGKTDHELVVVVNDFPFGNPNHKRWFEPLAIKQAWHNNQGKDIGAFMKVAETVPADLMLFLGAPLHFHKPGWLDQLVNAYENNGPGLYGPWVFHEPRRHVRTTAFMCAPELLRSYPFQVGNDNRYEFEHGANSFTNHVETLGLGVFQVTWQGCYAREGWHHTDRTESLMIDQHFDREGI